MCGFYVSSISQDKLVGRQDGNKQATEGRVTIKVGVQESSMVK